MTLLRLLVVVLVVCVQVTTKPRSVVPVVAVATKEDLALLVLHRKETQAVTEPSTFRLLRLTGVAAVALVALLLA